LAASRDAIASIRLKAPFFMAGITFSRAILAVLSTPQETVSLMAPSIGFLFGAVPPEGNIPAPALSRQLEPRPLFIRNQPLAAGHPYGAVHRWAKSG
jgi:hypothetical protein